MPALPLRLQSSLEHVLLTAAPSDAIEALAQVRKLSGADTITAVMRAYTAASRLARWPLTAAAWESAAIAADAPGVNFADWSRPDVARALLLIDVAVRSGDAACAEAATACYQAGDAAEQRSWLRAVSLLPSPAQYTALVIDACRTNILPVFEAAACGNPFPAEYLPERNFNQMVLKAMFNGVPLTRIHRLSERCNQELARMAGDYAAERRAAGRSVPDDIGLVL